MASFVPFNVRFRCEINGVPAVGNTRISPETVTTESAMNGNEVQGELHYQDQMEIDNNSNAVYDANVNLDQCGSGNNTMYNDTAMHGDSTMYGGNTMHPAQPEHNGMDFDYPAPTITMQIDEEKAATLQEVMQTGDPHFPGSSQNPAQTGFAGVPAMGIWPELVNTYSPAYSVSGYGSTGIAGNNIGMFGGAGNNSSGISPPTVVFTSLRPLGQTSSVAPPTVATETNNNVSNVVVSGHTFLPQDGPMQPVRPQTMVTGVTSSISNVVVSGLEKSSSQQPPLPDLEPIKSTSQQPQLPDHELQQPKSTSQQPSLADTPPSDVTIIKTEEKEVIKIETPQPPETTPAPVIGGASVPLQTVIDSDTIAYTPYGLLQSRQELFEKNGFMLDKKVKNYCDRGYSLVNDACAFGNMDGTLMRNITYGVVCCYEGGSLVNFNNDYYVQTALQALVFAVGNYYYIDNNDVKEVIIGLKECIGLRSACYKRDIILKHWQEMLVMGGASLSLTIRNKCSVGFVKSWEAFDLQADVKSGKPLFGFHEV